MDPAPNQVRDPILEMREVTVGSMRDPSRTVAESIDWSVHSGEYWVIGGLQGAGKTDFLMLVAGLMAPMKGSYRLFGQAMPIFAESRVRERLRVGLVFDGGQLLNHLTVRQNLALPIRYHRDLAAHQAVTAVNQMLALTELEAWADESPGRLARHLQTRTGLARALMLRPQLLLLDNPLSGLDARQASWWLAMLERLANGIPELDLPALTLVATASDLWPWRHRAKNFAVLEERRLHLLGSWKDVKSSKVEALRVLFTTEQ